jgi:hypothetical protein
MEGFLVGVEASEVLGGVQTECNLEKKCGPSTHGIAHDCSQGGVRGLLILVIASGSWALRIRLDLVQGGHVSVTDETLAFASK